MKRILLTFKNDNLKKRGALLVAASVISNFLNFFYNAYLGRAISFESFALISMLGSILSLTDVPISALGKTVNFKSAFLLGKYRYPATEFWRYLRKKAIFLSAILALIWLLLSVFIAKFFNVDDLLPIISFTPVWFLTILSAIDSGYLTGSLRFGAVALVAIAEAAIKLISAAFLVKIGLGQYAYFAILISSASAFALYAILALRIKQYKSKASMESKKFPIRFYLSTGLSRVSTVAYLSVDVLLAKHFLNPADAGLYALLSLTGKMVFFAGTLFSQFITPIVSHREGTGKSSMGAFLKLLSVSAISSFAAFIVVGAFGHYTIPVFFGVKASPIVPLIPWYAISMVAFTISSNIITYQLIKGRYIFPVVGFLVAGLQIVAIALFHGGLAQISTVMAAMGFISLAVVALTQVFYSSYKAFASNVKDLRAAFSNIASAEGSGLRILIFNWRDTHHKWAGGAEVYVQELAARWVKDGNTVILFCGNDRNNKPNETVDGVQIVRRGGFYTVYFWGMIYYIFKFRKNIDIVVDSENGIPFFSPLYTQKQVVLLIHHVHQEIFLEQLKFPWSYVAKFIEGKLMPMVYKNKPVITVSESSKKEIIKAGIAKEESIRIVNPGIELPTKQYKKTDFPSIVYLGRLKPYKNVDIAIKAFARIANKFPSARFLIVGDGESANYLKELAKKIKLSTKISFVGRVSEQQKVKLLSKSWIAIQPSTVEGWGITVIEANACKTPVIASNTNGLRDSIIDGKTGILAKTKDIQNFASHMEYLLASKKVRIEMSENAYKWAHNFDWGRSANEFLSIATSMSQVRGRAFVFSRATSAFNKVISLFGI